LQQKQELPIIIIIIIIITFTCHAQQAHSALQDQKWATWQAAGMVVVGMLEKAKAWKVHE
jgi:hypothetical protein